MIDWVIKFKKTQSGQNVTSTKKSWFFFLQIFTLNAKDQFFFLFLKDVEHLKDIDYRASKGCRASKVFRASKRC